MSRSPSRSSRRSTRRNCGRHGRKCCRRRLPACARRGDTGGRGTRIALRPARAFRFLVGGAGDGRLAGAARRIPAQAKLQTDWQERRAAELAQLDGANRTRHVAFWSEMLKDAPLPLPFAQRSRALAPVGFGLNRGPTARIAALLSPHAASESTLLAAFARALGGGHRPFRLLDRVRHRWTGIGKRARHGRPAGGHGAAGLPRRCHGAAGSAGARIARDLRHARAHAAFDLAACEETFGAAWRAAGIVPRQIGFSYMSRNDNPPAC